MEPLITPKKLLGEKTLPIKCDVAFICFCPTPKAFSECEIPIPLKERYFIHSNNSNVLFCEYNKQKFIVISEVYGGPVGVTTVEELHYYGVKKIIALGFVGSLDSKIPCGTMIRAKDSFNEIGTTPHYLNHESKFSYPTGKSIFRDDIESINMKDVTVWTTNALYREYSHQVLQMKELGCQVVNMDTSHFFASTDLLKIESEYFAIVSDVLDEAWENELKEAIEDEKTSKVSSSQDILIQRILFRLFCK